MWRAECGNASYLDCNDGFTVYIHFKCVQFLGLQLCFTEFFFFKKEVIYHNSVSGENIVYFLK